MIAKNSAKYAALSLVTYWGERVAYNNIREGITGYPYRGTSRHDNDIRARKDAKSLAYALGATESDILAAYDRVFDTLDHIENKVRADLAAETEQ